MKYFVVKISNIANVNLIKSKQAFVHEGIYQFENELNIGSLVFLVFGGDKAKISWDPGLIGYGEIIRAPYNKGYDSTNRKNFKIEIQPKTVLNNSIPLEETKTFGLYAKELYDVPYVGAKQFPTQAISSTNQAGHDALMKALQYYASGNVQQSMVAEKSLETFIEQSHADFTNAGLRIPDGLLLRISASLLAKRFLILTGLSGSGKTKLAHALASWLTTNTTDNSLPSYRVVAVGADWTTNDNVLGYPDALQPSFYRKPSSGALDIILQAKNDPTHPHFLILDEMNLSHVERYFADILSSIESSQDIALHSSPEGLKSSENDTSLVPSKISLPKNLFIIGTVNVDETTYMFSPKVLDRANVIEFRATAEDITAFLEAPSAVDMISLSGKGAAFGVAFVAEATAEIQLESTIAKELKDSLGEVFATLAPIGAEFGFRTAYEISRFTHYHNKLTGDGWQFNDALDAQVLQKLMPKLHGSQRRLEPVLKALETFCESHKCDASLEKIHRMQDRLKDGFTSFTEA